MPLGRVVHPLLLADRVFDEIKSAVLSGELPEGTPLKVRDLADQVGTSVMPVREAIRRLEESGLAVREPHKGAVVKTLSVTELDQIYDVRILLECEAARRGAALSKPAEHARMRRLHADVTRSVAAGRLIDALELDESLLTVLYEAANNVTLMESIRHLWNRCRLYKVRSVRSTGDRVDHNAWSHLPLLMTAAENADGATAARITRNSLVDAQRQVAGSLVSA